MKGFLVFPVLLIFLLGTPVYASGGVLTLNNFTEKIRQREAATRDYHKKVARTTSGDTELGESRIFISERLANRPPMAEEKILDLYRQVLIAKFSRGRAKTPKDRIIASRKIHKLVEKGVPAEILIMDEIEWVKSKMSPALLTATFDHRWRVPC